MGFRWFFVFQKDFLLQNELELGIELLFVGRSDDRGTEPFYGRELTRIDIECDKMNRKALRLLLGPLFEPRQYSLRRRSDRVEPVSNDEHVFTRKRRLQDGICCRG